MSHNFKIEYNNPASGKSHKISNQIIEANASISEICYKYNPLNAFIKIKNSNFDFDFDFALNRFGYSVLRGFIEVLDILNGNAESSKSYPDTVEWNPKTDKFACFIIGEVMGEIPVFAFVINNDIVKFYTRTIIVGQSQKPEIYQGRDSEEPISIQRIELKQKLQNATRSYLFDLENSFSNIGNSKEFQNFKSISIQ